jgi:hypothetical protein
MNKTLFICFIIFFSVRFLQAQTDILSQYYYNQPMQNPALTGLMENKWKLQHFRRYENNADFKALNQTWEAEIKIAFSKQVGEYGLNIKEYSGMMMGIGILDNRVMHEMETDKFRADYLSLSFHKILKNKSYFSIGLQPGFSRMYDTKKFDLNAGISFGSNQIECWTEDQYFKTQIGLAAYNIFSDFRHNDTTYFPGRRIQFHGGYLIKEPKHFNIFVNAQTWYDSEFNFSAGANVLFFPIVHYKYYDRGRLGLHFRSSNHLVLSGGFRLYGRGQKTISLDMTMSYDFGMRFLDLEPGYKRGLEFGIILTPLKKCWSLSKC